MSENKINQINSQSSQQQSQSQSSQSSVFGIISDRLVKECNKKGILITSSKFISNEQLFYIQLLYKKSTEFNPFKDDILFSITLTQAFPIEEPYVRCLSNFSYPTLFDNRNYLFSILKHPWRPEGCKSEYDLMEEIVLKIPSLINRVNEDSINQILVYYGDYRIDSIYEINDFLSNDLLSFFRVMLHQKEQKERYIILTEVYFLLFDPAPDAKNLGKLVFWGDIRQLKDSQRGKVKDKETIVLNWKGGLKDIMFEFEIVKETYDQFLSETDKKIKKLIEKYELFQEDEGKPREDEDYQDSIIVSKENIETVKALISHKERLYEKEKTLNVITELTMLYEKIIEVLSAENDMTYENYLVKLKKMLQEKKTIEEIDKEQYTKQKFKMSKSYDDER